MFPNGRSIKYHGDNTLNESKVKDNGNVWTTTKSGDKVYDYEEAIELAGNGRYTLGMIGATSLSFLAMGIDMFSFSTVVALSQCHLQLDLQKAAILMSTPFIGSIAMAYAWGYISDTQGRHRSLQVAMSCSFVMSVLCAFAPEWITLAVFKLIGSCFCSAAQSLTYALMGESCASRVRGMYLLVITCVAHFSMVLYFTLAHLIGFLDFSLDLVFITFVPWRLLVLILALPLGISAFVLLFFYESPKFLLTMGKEEDALEILKKICHRNGLDGSVYPVKRLFFTRTQQKCKDINLMQSLQAHTVPLFKPPLLCKTLLLFYCTIIIYSTTGAIYVWLPFLAEPFTYGVTTEEYSGRGICSMIGSKNNDTATNTADDDSDVELCTTVGLPILLFALVSAVCLGSLNGVLSWLSSRKKALFIALLVVSAVSSAATQLFSNNVVNVILYFGIMLVSLANGIISSYFVDLFPTSHLGMASCLGVMVARLSTVVGVNWLGPFMLSHCTEVFSFWACCLLSTALVACFIPTTTTNKENSTKKMDSDKDNAKI